MFWFDNGTPVNQVLGSQLPAGRLSCPTPSRTRRQPGGVGSVGSGQALVALGRGTRLVAAVSLNAHERLGRLADWLRPGSLFDDPGPDEEQLLMASGG